MNERGVTHISQEIVKVLPHNFKNEIAFMNYLNQNEEKFKPVVQELNLLLAEYQMYYQKLRNFHWNVQGRNFFDLHAKFEEMYTDARTKIDEIAERILTLRQRPLSNLSDYIRNATMDESPANLRDIEMVRELLQSHNILRLQMTEVVEQAEKINDEGTLDLIGAYIRELEKVSWMLDAWTKSTEKEPAQALA